MIEDIGSMIETGGGSPDKTKNGEVVSVKNINIERTWEICRGVNAYLSKEKDPLVFHLG